MLRARWICPFRNNLRFRKQCVNVIVANKPRWWLSADWECNLRTGNCIAKIFQKMRIENKRVNSKMSSGAWIIETWLPTAGVAERHRYRPFANKSQISCRSWSPNFPSFNRSVRLTVSLNFSKVSCWSGLLAKCSRLGRIDCVLLVVIIHKLETKFIFFSLLLSIYSASWHLKGK